MRVVAAPDKFRGTATAADVAGAVADACRVAGATCDRVPMADGGEGTLAALGGPTRSSTVTGPLGDPVTASWRLHRRTAVIEMAQASGLLLAGGPEGNDPIAASTTGTGELIAAAVELGATRVLVGVGGSATTDGGFGALRALYPPQRLRAIELVVACDVRTPFLEAAHTFAPQKGATPAQVTLLANRLTRLAQVYEETYGVDVRGLEGGGAAGGLAGGLAAVGAELLSGFELVAEELELAERMEGADLVVTGEGFVDEQSYDGKVVGGVLELAAELGVPALVVAGQVFDGVPQGAITISLADRFGLETAQTDPLTCLQTVVREHLTTL